MTLDELHELEQACIRYPHVTIEAEKMKELIAFARTALEPKQYADTYGSTLKISDLPGYNCP